MHYTTLYQSPLGDIFLACDDIGLTGLWFKGQKHFAAGLSSEHIFIENHEQLPILLTEVIRWLDIYFSGDTPDFTPSLHLSGTLFQLEIWEILLTISHGTTTTYGEIAKKLAKKHGLLSMSAQAVGNAVGRNPVSIIVPCHRVLGSNGKLTGYAGGIERKQALLMLEINTSLVF